jgi:hypothetical protein
VVVQRSDNRAQSRRSAWPRDFRPPLARRYRMSRSGASGRPRERRDGRYCFSGMCRVTNYLDASAAFGGMPRIAVVRPGRWASGHRCELVIMPSAAGPAVSVRSRTTLMRCLTTTAAAGSSIASASRPGIAACQASLRFQFARARMPVSYSTPSLMALILGVASRRQSYARRR